MRKKLQVSLNGNLMPKIHSKNIKKLPVKEKPLHIPLAFEDALKLALNTPIKKSKIGKNKNQ